MTKSPLHLRIINMTSLPDGGPLEVSVAPGDMLEAGRDSGLDWCLPDPNRFISSRHFEIRSERSGWMLYDVSTNGTFLNGAASRVKSPCPLHDGDRLQVGQYSIEIRSGSVQSDTAATPPASAPEPVQQRPAARSLPGGLDPWAVQTAPPQASPLTHPPAAPEADAAQWSMPEQPRATADIWAMPSGRSQPPSEATRPVHDTTPAWPPGPGQRSTPAPEAFAVPPESALPDDGQQTALPAFMPADARDAAARGSPTAQPVAGDQALLEIIESAAGLAAGTLSRSDAHATAREIGETLRTLTEELSGLLQARAVARRSVRSAQVTMIGREDNNPLKFMPTPDQALSIMFGPTRPGFQRGPAAVRSGFADIKSHQYATHAALQPALAQLLEELAPEAIEKRLEGVRLNRKSRAWEMYVERWDAKTESHDNGMLDVFLALYAEAYDRESGRG